MTDQMPKEIYDFMELYQAGQRRPSVEFIPVPYRSSATAPENEK